MVETMTVTVENKLLDCIPLGLQVLQGRNVSLVRSAPEHTDFIYSCYQNNAFMDLYRLAQNRSETKDEVRHRLEVEHIKLPQELKRIEWVIVKHAEHQDIPVGLAALADHQVTHRRAEILLGIPDTQNRAGNLSLEASLLVLDFAFNQAGIHKVTSLVYGYNDYAQKNTIHLGFKQEGLLKQHIYTESGFVDLYQNGLLRVDFLNNKALKILSKRLIGRDITRQNSVKISPISKLLLDQLTQQLKISS